MSRFRSPAWGHRDTETLPDRPSSGCWYIGAIIALIAITVALAALLT